MYMCAVPELSMPIMVLEIPMSVAFMGESRVNT